MYGWFLNYITFYIDCMQAKPYLQADAFEIVDDSLRGGFAVESMRKAASIAVRSVERDASERPTMAEVLAELKEAYSIQLTSFSSVGHLSWSSHLSLRVHVFHMIFTLGQFLVWSCNIAKGKYTVIVMWCCVWKLYMLKNLIWRDYIDVKYKYRN